MVAAYLGHTGVRGKFVYVYRVRSSRWCVAMEQYPCGIEFIRHYAMDAEYVDTPGRKVVSKAWKAALLEQAIVMATQARDLRKPNSFGLQQLPERSVFELYRLLHLFRASDATLPHDKVYGLLGIVEGAEDVGLDLDYSLPFKVVYANLVKHHVQKYTVLDVLEYPNTLGISLGAYLPGSQIGVSKMGEICYPRALARMASVFSMQAVHLNPRSSFLLIAEPFLFKASY